jgi:hypothetical protein
MFTKVSVLIPTRHRIEQLQVLLESYGRTTQGQDSELVFRVDDDDQETVTFLTGYHHTVVVGPRFHGYQSMPVFFNEMAQCADGDVLMCGNDDMVFQTNDWPLHILEVANQFPDGLFDIEVTTHNETHCHFSTVSKKVVDRLGFLWDPRVFWGDIYLRDVMACFGRCIMLSFVQIDHDWAGWRPDRVFMESDKDITGKDATDWSGTHLTAVNEAVSRLTWLLA